MLKSCSARTGALAAAMVWASVKGGVRVCAVSACETPRAQQRRKPDTRARARVRRFDRTTKFLIAAGCGASWREVRGPRLSARRRLQTGEHAASILGPGIFVTARDSGLEVTARALVLPSMQLRHPKVIPDLFHVGRLLCGALEHGECIGVLAPLEVHPTRGIQQLTCVRGGE